MNGPPIDARAIGAVLQQQEPRQRSYLLAQVLSQLNQANNQPRTPISLAANLGAVALNKVAAQRALAGEQAQQQGQNQALAQALQQAQGGMQSLPGTGVQLGNPAHPFGGSPADPMGGAGSALASGHAMGPQVAARLMEEAFKKPEMGLVAAGDRLMQTMDGNPTGRSFPIGLSPDTRATEAGATSRNQATIASSEREGKLDRAAAAARQQAQIANDKELAKIAAEQDKLKTSEKDKNVGLLFGSMIGAEKALSTMTGPDTSSKWNALLGSNQATKVFQSDAFRKYESSALRWAANALYIKSGATAPPEEVKSTYMQFFPQPGDGPDVVAQKNAARQEELANIRAMYPQVTAWYEDPYAAKSGATQGRRVYNPQTGRIEDATGN